MRVETVALLWPLRQDDEPLLAVPEDAKEAWQLGSRPGFAQVAEHTIALVRSVPLDVKQAL